MGVDLVDRDPSNINPHVKVAFEDVLAEPDGIHSIDCVWKLSYTCFEGCKGLCYKIATTLCGIFIACCWGIEFAGIAFNHIWYITPCLKVWEINCGCAQKLWTSLVNCFVLPLCDAMGHCFSWIIVTNKT